MADFITLSCPSCGNKLQITEDIEKFACAACGNEHIVNRSGGIVTLKPVIDSITKVQIGVDKTASELAIVRLNEEIKNIKLNIVSVEKEDIDNGRVLRNLGAVFITLATLLILVNVNNKSNVVCFSIGVINGIIGLLLFYWGNKASKDAKQNKDEKLKKLWVILISKEKELAEHHNTVSLNK